jgi:AraC-like DNA-binding protein/mannose-6-phosphate isomerase-like protein (cupin superfamily)
MDKKKLDELLRKQYFYEIVNLAPHASKDWVSGKYAEVADAYDVDFLRKRPSLMMNTHGASGTFIPRVSEHKHPHFEMMYVYDGHITHNIGNDIVALNKGDILLMAPETSHSIDECGSEDIAVNIIISPEFLTPDFMQMLSSNSLFSGFMMRPEKTQKSSDSGYIYFPSGSDDAVYDTSVDIMCEFFDPDISSASTIKCLLIVLFNSLFRVWKKNGGKVETRSDIDNNDIWQIMQYIESNYSTATLNEAAFRFGYDPYYLSRLIKKKLGHTFTEIKHRVCVEQAKSMLTHTAKSIQEIAMQTGFSNMSYFYLLFDKYCGMTPAEYRKKP